MRSSPVIMGIVNVTPDSFSDGGRLASVTQAVDHAVRLLDEGAGVLDIGGESTRPGASPVSATEESARVLPVIEGILAVRPQAIISIDTSKAGVARQAIEAGARWVNDVTALADPEMAGVCAETGCELVLMHMRGTPQTMQADTAYRSLIGEVVERLVAARDRAVDEGVAPERILLDPGVGFGKSFEDNPRLFASIPRLQSFGHRVLVGASRKGFIGRLTGVEVASERVHGSVGAALAAALWGADVVRVHDVAATVQALTVFQACSEGAA